MVSVSIVLSRGKKINVPALLIKDRDHKGVLFSCIILQGVFFVLVVEKFNVFTSRDRLIRMK